MRAQAANMFFYTRIAHLTSFIRSLWLKDLPILAYHRVCDVPDDSRYPFDVELVSASVADFAWQMEYVLHHFTPITFADLLRAVDGEGELPPRPIIITFDDGFSDNYVNAYPILRRLHVPASVFLSTGYIGGARTFWYDWLAYVVNRVPDCTWRIAELNLTLAINGDIAERRRTLRCLIDRIKVLPNAMRIAILGRIEKVWGHCYDGPELHLSRPLTWAQVREMAANGIEFGSHSVTHPVLTSLDDDTLRYELGDSKRELERHLGQPVATLAYPVGRSFAFDGRVIDTARKLGYRLGISYMRGTNPLAAIEPFALRRIPVEKFMDRCEYASVLSLPEVFLDVSERSS